MKILKVTVFCIAALVFTMGVYTGIATIPYRYSGNAGGADVYLKHRYDLAQVYAAEPITVTASDCDPFAVSVDGHIVPIRYVQEVTSCQGGGFIAQFTVQESTLFLENGRFVHIDLEGNRVVWVQVSMSEMTVMMFIMMAIMMLLLSGTLFSLAASPYW